MSKLLEFGTTSQAGKWTKIATEWYPINEKGDGKIMEKMEDGVPTHCRKTSLDWQNLMTGGILTILKHDW